MKQHEVELVLAARAYLVIQGIEYENIGGSREEGFCFATVRHEGWAKLTYDQLIKNDYSIRIKDKYKMLDLGAISAHEYCVNSHGYNFYCIIGNHINGGFITIINLDIVAIFEPNKNAQNCVNLIAAFEKNELIAQCFSKDEQENICAEIADNLTPYI